MQGTRVLHVSLQDASGNLAAPWTCNAKLVPIQTGFDFLHACTHLCCRQEEPQAGPLPDI